MIGTVKVNVSEGNIVIETYSITVTHQRAFDTLGIAINDLLTTTYKNQVTHTNRNSGNRSANLYLDDGRIAFIKVL